VSLDESTHIERWVEASQRRAERFNIVQFAWTERHTYEVGGAAPQTHAVHTGKEPDDSPIFTVGIPHVRREFADLKKWLSLNGTMMRFKTHSLSIVDPLNICYHEHEASNNGDYSRVTTRSGEQQHGLLHYDQQVNAMYSMYRLMPITLAVRAHDDRTFGQVFDNPAERILETALEDGMLCIASPREKVWLDPAKDYLPIRVERWKPKFDVIIDRIEIELAEHPDFGLLPNGWSYTLFDSSSGKPRRTFVTSGVEVAIRATTKSDFELKFWPGIRVHQRRGDGTVWVATETGDLRLATEDEKNG